MSRKYGNKVAAKQLTQFKSKEAQIRGDKRFIESQVEIEPKFNVPKTRQTFDIEMIDEAKTIPPTNWEKLREMFEAMSKVDRYRGMYGFDYSQLEQRMMARDDFKRTARNRGEDSRTIVRLGDWSFVDTAMCLLTGEAYKNFIDGLKQEFKFIKVTFGRRAYDDMIEMRCSLSQHNGDTLYCEFAGHTPLSTLVQYMKEAVQKHAQQTGRHQQSLPEQERTAEVGVYDNPETDCREVYSLGHMVCQFNQKYLHEYLIWEYGPGSQSGDGWAIRDMYHKDYVFNRPWDAGSIYGNSDDLPRDIYDNLE